MISGKVEWGRKWILAIGLLLLYVGTVLGDDMEGMDMEGDGLDEDSRPEFHPKNPKSKSFHWIFSLAILLALSSVASAFAFANRLATSVILEAVITAYSVVETLFLDFPDNEDNHENRTSKGTSFFLSFLLGCTVFMGTLINGTNYVMNRFYPQVATRVGQTSIAYKIYKVLTFLAVLVGYVRVCMAPVALLGFCYDDHLEQCLAHGIMGSSFILYGFIYTVILIIPWIRKHHLVPGNQDIKSQEFYDSLVMCLWGIINTFTEHKWNREPWHHHDYQHTSMGILWWCGGLLGMWLSRKNNRRSFLPSLMLIYTGYGMAQHPQELPISTKVHALFGFVLMLAGLSRIVEILFLLSDQRSSRSGKILSFQHFPPFGLVASGILFMSATEEQMQLVHELGADHSSYVLVLTGASFVVYLWFLLVLQLYLHLLGYDEDGELTSHKYSYEQFNSAAHDFELGDLSDNENRDSSTPDLE